VTSETTAVHRKSSTGLLISVVGIVLIILAAGYAFYEKYYRHLNFKLLAFHPLVDGVGVLGLIVLIVGAVLMMRRQ
jgi:Co/Zn/Cd efflux system component